MVAQKQYNLYQNKKVRFKPVFAPGSYEFVDRSPLATTAAKRLTAKKCSKAKPKKDDSYRVLCVGPV